MRQSHRTTPPYHRAVLVIHKQEVHSDLWTNIHNYNPTRREVGLLNLQCCGGTRQSYRSILRSSLEGIIT